MTRLKSFISFCLFLTLIMLSFSACRNVRIKEHQEWKPYFEQNGIHDACFEMYDNNKEIAMYYNKKRCSEQMSPGATFDPFNALVALSANVALDEAFKLEVKDSVLHTVDTLSLSQAFKTENKAYFEKLAGLTGAKQMQQGLDTIQYGNKTIGKHVHNFFNNGSLKITADEMVGFMKCLYHGELPTFDQRSIRLVQNMMLQEKETNEKLYYRYASIQQRDSTLHWLVGYMEHIEDLKNAKTNKINHVPHPYFFAMNFTTPTDSGKAWKTISVHILKEILKSNHSND